MPVLGVHLFQGERPGPPRDTPKAPHNSTERNLGRNEYPPLVERKDSSHNFLNARPLPRRPSKQLFYEPPHLCGDGARERCGSATQDERVPRHAEADRGLTAAQRC